MGQKTPIYDLHLASGAKMVDFAGWDMPIHYGSQIEEHHAVRQSVGICDVSHMTVIDVSGDDACPYLRYLLANDVARLDEIGKALYSAMCNDEGGVIDDLIVYRTAPGYRVVVNCATREKDLAWMRDKAADFKVELTERPDLAILAVQGPGSLERVAGVLDESVGQVIDSLSPFTAAEAGSLFIARTGYTGEVGVELILPGQEAPALWESLVAAGARPVGLGARDTLRLEAGMNLYGNDMDETVTPLESNMAFSVVLEDDRDFIGASQLRVQKAGGLQRRLSGFVMEERGVLRAHYPVYSGDRMVGEITSGAFSPTLGYSIALARVEAGASGPWSVDIRGKRKPVNRVRPPFVRNGKAVFKVLA